MLGNFTPNQRCAWTGFWVLIIADSNRIRSEVFFAVAGLDFVFVEKTLLVIFLTYSFAESNRNRIACIMLVPDSERIWIVSLQNRIGSRKTKVRIPLHQSRSSERAPTRTLYLKPPPQRLRSLQNTSICCQLHVHAPHQSLQLSNHHSGNWFTADRLPPAGNAWVQLNRLRTGVGRFAANMKVIGLCFSDLCV